MRNIDADKLLEEFDEYEPGEDFEYEHDLWLDLRLAVINAPAADVAPVVHGEWIGVRNGKGICSHCNRLDSIDPLATHCRYCGAKMVGERKGDE